MCSKKPPEGDDDFIEFLGFLSWLSDEFDRAQEEVHRHKCPDCGHIWSHRAKDIEDGGSEKAHTCGQCGCKADGCYKRFREKEVVKCRASIPSAP